MTPGKRAHLKAVWDQKVAENLREASITRDRLLRAYKVAHAEFARAFEEAKERLGVDGVCAVLNAIPRGADNREGMTIQSEGEEQR